MGIHILNILRTGTLLIAVFMIIAFKPAYSQKDEEKIEKLKTELQEAKASGNPKKVVELSKKLGDIHFNEGAFNDAGIYYEKLISTAFQNELYGLTFNYAMELGKAYEQQSVLGEAEHLFKKAVDAAKILRNKQHVAKALLNYGRLLRMNQRGDKAIEVLKELEKIAKFELNSKPLRLDTYEQLTKAYKQVGNEDQYLRYLELSKVKKMQSEKERAESQARNLEKENLAKEGKIEKQIAEIRNIRDSLKVVELLREKEEYQNKLKDQKIQNQELEIENQRNIRNFLILLLGITLVFAILWYLQYRQKKRVNKQLVEQNTKIREQKEKIEKQAKALFFSNRELEKLSIVAQETSNAVAIISSDFAIEWTNPAFSTIHGYDNKEIQANYGMPIEENDCNILQLERLKECRNFRKVVQYEAEHADQEKSYWTQVTLTPILNKSNQVIKLISVETDITKIKELEEFKARLTRMIVHDLKNPLNSIMGVTELMEESEHLNYIKVASEQMLNMVENILDVQKLENNQMDLDIQKYDIKNVVEQAVEDVRLIIEVSKDNKLKLVRNAGEGLVASFDFENIKRVMVNLLTNAIKYTPDGGSVSISAKQIRRKESDYIKVSVKDTGFGIPAEMQEQIFNQFIQVNAQNSGRSKSTGIGLTFCKLMVEAHDGDIHVESEVDEGSDFYFYLPVGN